MSHLYLFKEMLVISIATSFTKFSFVKLTLKINADKTV